LVLVPDHEDMSSKLGSLAQEFLDSVYIDDYIPGGKPKTVRKRETDTDSNKPKKVAKIADFGDMNDIASRGKVRYITLSFCFNVFYLLEVQIVCMLLYSMIQGDTCEFGLSLVTSLYVILTVGCNQWLTVTCHLFQNALEHVCSSVIKWYLLYYGTSFCVPC
jgi:hypothetical protein